MEYCSFVVEGGPVWAVRKFQTLQNDALRICERIRDPRGVDVDGLHERLKVPKLEPARTRQLLGYLHKTAQDESNVIQPRRVLRGNANVHLKVMRAKKDIYEKSPLYRGAPVWDLLDATTQHLTDNKKFLASLKGDQ